MTTHKKPKKPCPSGGCTLELPSELTKVGLTGDQKAIAIMLIVENKKPLEGNYDAIKTGESMRLMRQVIINRLKSPRDYAAAGAKTSIDIIKAPKQFQGLSNYPKTSNELYNAFEDVLDSKIPVVKNYVDMAIKIAALDENSIQATIPNVTGWMTAGSNPGKGFKAIKTIAGNTFFIHDPDHHSPKAKSSKKKTSMTHAKKHPSSKKQSSSKTVRKSKK